MSKIVGQQIKLANQTYVDNSTLISVANTGILGRAQIADPSKNLSVNLGVNRVTIQSIYPLQNETGASREIVWSAANDVNDLIRFVGAWSNVADPDGSYPLHSVAGDYVEIVFYGTGINILSQLNSSAKDMRYTLDGGTESANFLINAGVTSGISTSRNYAVNQVIPVVSGLTLATHTIKLRAATTGGIRFYGYEVLNESTQIKTNTGTAYSAGNSAILAAQDSSAFSSGFTNVSGTAGSRGGHALVYQKADGTIAKDIQYTNTAQANLDLADHTNEEVVRVFSIREFGANRTDDFSTLVASGSNRAFTLDDDTTTFSGTNMSIGAVSGLPDGVAFSAINNSMTFTFVGTGLDVEYRGLNGAAATNHFWFIDGTDISFPQTDVLISTRVTRRKVVSGLPYGTHTFRYSVSGSTPEGQVMSKFIVYQPKKPALPTGAVELADYNLVATFAANTTADSTHLSTGVIRKDGYREVTFIEGTGGSTNWSNPGANTYATGTVGQAEFASDRTNAAFQYSFFGTGFDLRFLSFTNRSNSVQVSLNGINATTTNFPTMTTSVYGGPAFTASTGILNQNAATNQAVGFTMSALPLAFYTVKFLNNNTSNFINMSTIDIITPIHSSKSNLYMDLQNTLMVGSQAISDNRKVGPNAVNPTLTKAWAQAVGIASSPTLSSTGVYVPAPDMAVIIKVAANAVLDISYAICSANSTSGNGQNFQLYVDGLIVPSSAMTGNDSAGFYNTVTDRRLVPVSAGAHRVEIYWLSGSGTNTMLGTNRVLTVKEL